MSQIQKRILIVLGAALVAVAGHVAYSYHTATLAAADLRTATAEANFRGEREHAEQVLDYAATLTGDIRLAEWRAEQSDARADSAESRAHAAEVRTARTAAQYAALPVPDTCAKLKAAADTAIADAQSAADSWRLAYTEKEAAALGFKQAADSADAGRLAALRALADLRSASSDLSDATKRLRHAAKPSLLARLTPKVGVGVAAGVDIAQRPNAVVGVTFGWSFR